MAIDITVPDEEYTGRRPAPTTSSIDLAWDDVLEISPDSIIRSYTKGTLTAPFPPASMTISNKSDALTFEVGFRGAGGVYFTPSSVRLSPLQKQQVIVTLKPEELESLSTGVNEVTCIIDATSIKVIEDTRPTDPTKPSIPPPPDEPVVVPVSLKLEVYSGNNQSWYPSKTLLEPFAVVVKDSNGNGVSGRVISWKVMSGGGTTTQHLSKTNDAGVASTFYTLGTTLGTNSVRASLLDSELFVTFVSIAITENVPDGERDITEEPGTGGGVIGDEELEENIEYADKIRRALRT